MKRFSVVAIIVSLLLCSAFAGPVSHFGALKRCGKNICGSKNGTESTSIFFKGPSLFWSDGSGAPFYKAETVDWFVDTFQIGIIRAAMAIKYYGENKEEINKGGSVPGYLISSDAATRQKALVRAVIDAAILNDIYVIVDWHSHVAHNETSSAKDFFVEIANAYKNVPNIIWEVYNEPMGASTSQVTNHANTIISALRSAGNTNLVIIGSPSWSQKPNDQARDWGSSRDQNVAFAFHFYSGTHGFSSGDIANNAKGAMSAGYAIFGSEWGGTNADGEGSFNSSSADPWTSWMDSEKISNCMWSASDAPKGNDYNATEAQASAFFQRPTSTVNLSTSRLTNSGKYFQTYMNKNKWTAQIPSNHPKGNDVANKSVKDGNSITLSSSDLGLDGEISKVSEPEFGTAEKTANSIKYTTPSIGSPSEKVKLYYEITKGSITVKRKITINITDRRPVLPEKAPIAVSRKAATDINIISTLSVQDPTGGGVEFDAVTVSPSSMGTISISSNKQIATFTPAKSQNNVESAEATLNYTVKAKSGGSNSSSVVLKLQNFAPTIRSQGGTYAPKMPNTDPVGLGMVQNRFNGKDADGDSIWFVDKPYLDKQYPGRLEKIKADSFVYYPEAGKIGKVTFLAVITDGSLKSVTGGLTIELTGSGSEINVTPPTSIPGVVDPDPPDPEEPEPPVLAYPSINAKGMGLSSLGFGKIGLYLASSGIAKLDVYSLSGKNVGNLLNGNQNAGSKEVSLNSLNLQKGVYILRLSQGGQVKTLRIMN